jgi:hypothetical protein
LDTEDFRPGGTVTVTVRCTIRLQDLGLPFTPGNWTTSATYAARSTCTEEFPAGS